jgi:hypothetical protein
MRHRWYSLSVTCLLLICFQLAAVSPVDATKVMRRNIQELVSMGDQIVVGKVVQVRDGIDAQNVPYTEVTIQVKETPKGTASGSYTFRQFGLTKPRDMGNGYTNLNVTPDGWPTYAQGEDVVVFLYKEAAWTGLRTTVGLMQGKFTIKDGYVANDVNNEGLFSGVQVSKRNLDEKEQAMLQMKHGRVPEDVFMSFLRKSTTQDRFFEEMGGE